METTSTTPVPKKKRAAKATTPRAPRVIDPAIAAIRANAKLQVAQLRLARLSGQALETITTKWLVKLTSDHKKMLVNDLNNRISHSLTASPLKEDA